MSRKELLTDYIEWLSQKEDVFYAFDNPEETAIEYLKKQ